MSEDVWYHRCVLEDFRSGQLLVPRNPNFAGIIQAKDRLLPGQDGSEVLHRTEALLWKEQLAYTNDTCWFNGKRAFPLTPSAKSKSCLLWTRFANCFRVNFLFPLDVLVSSSTTYEAESMGLSCYPIDISWLPVMLGKCWTSFPPFSSLSRSSSLTFYSAILFQITQFNYSN